MFQIEDCVTDCYIKSAELQFKHIGLRNKINSGDSVYSNADHSMSRATTLPHVFAR